MKRLIMVLMALRNISWDAALDLVLDARLKVIDGANPEFVLERNLGVDSSYLDALVS